MEIMWRRLDQNNIVCKKNGWQTTAGVHVVISNAQVYIQRCAVKVLKTLQQFFFVTN